MFKYLISAAKKPPTFIQTFINDYFHDFGVNSAWLEFGYKSPIKAHAVWDVGHASASLPNFVDNGLGLVRLPILWERIQPLLHGDLATPHVDVITAFLDDCASNNIKVILDIHNYCRRAEAPYYDLTNISGTFSVGDTIDAAPDSSQSSLRASATIMAVSGSRITCSRFQLIDPIVNGVTDMGGYIESSSGATADVVAFQGEVFRQFGNPELPESAFNDLWVKMVAAFGSHSAVVGYDLMNEPPGSMAPIDGEAAADIWLRYAQSCTNAIRAVDTTTTLYIEGFGWSAGHQWADRNPNIHNFTDPANNFKWSFHNYLDSDNSGTNFIVPVSSTIGSERAAAMLAWAQSHGYSGTDLHWGELGASYDGATSGGNTIGAGWIAALEDALTFARDNGIQVTGWSAGHMWGDYGYTLEPSSYQGLTQSAPQLGIYRKVIGEFGGQVFDSGGFVAVPDAEVTVRVYLRGYIEQSITINLAVAGIAQVSTNQITIPVGLNPETSYTISSAEGASTVTYSRPDGGQVPPVRGFSASVSPIESTVQLGVYSFEKEVGSYTGNALVAYRETTGDTQEFPFVGSQVGDTIDYAAILAWANGETVRAILKDQSGLGRDMRARTWTGSSQGAVLNEMDWPFLALDPDNNEPALRFDAGDNTRVELPIPIRLKNKLTQIVRTYPQNNNRLLSWESTDQYVLQANEHGLSFDSDGDADEPDLTLAVNAPGDQWSTITISDDRSQDINTFGSFGKRSAYLGSTKVDETNNYIPNISLTSNSPINQANVGWFVFYAPSRFTGYIRSIVILDDALNETEVALVDSQLA